MSDESGKKKLTNLLGHLKLCFFFIIVFSDAVPSLKEISSLTKDSFDLAMYCLNSGLFETQSQNGILRF